MKNKLLKEFLGYSSSTILFQFSRVAVDLTVAKIIGPKLWGLWYLLNLIISYRSAIDFGLISGMSREIPISVGACKNELANKIANSTISIIIILSVIASMIIGTLAVILTSSESAYYLLMIPLFLGVQFYFYLVAYSKAFIKFSSVSKTQGCYAILYVLFCLTLSYCYGLGGFIIGQAIVMFICSFMLFKMSKVEIRFNLDLEIIRHLIKVGFPIMAVGLAFTLLNTVDRFIITLYFDVQDLGYYSLAIMVFTSLNLLPGLISQQYYPRMAREWGQSGSVIRLYVWIRKQTKYVAFIIYPIATLVYFLFPPIIKIYLPQYVESISSIKIIVFSILMMPISAGWGNLINIINKQWSYLIIILSMVVLNLFGNIYIVENYDMGIEGIAVVTVCTFILYNIIIAYYGHYEFQKMYNS